MPRITRKNSTKEVTLDSSPEKDDKIQVKAEISNTSQTSNHPQSQYVMIVPDDMLESTKISVVTLRNPRTNIGTLYAFSHKNTKVYEINQYEESKRSWFLDNSVQSDGSFFMTTKIDPLFLVLPYLCKAKHTSPIDQLVVDEEFVDTVKLISSVKQEDLEKIADCKLSGSFQAWKYNEEKTLAWLGKKVSSLSKNLKQSNFNVSQAAISSNYVKTEKVEIPESTYMRYAHGLVSEYLSDELSLTLEKHLDLPVLPKEITNNESKEPPAKRQKLGNENNEPLEDYSKDQKPLAKEKLQVSAKSKALANAAKGSKSISSFFGKK